MRRLLLFISIMAASIAASATVTLPSGPLCYEARYHCGFIHIDAGKAYITLSLNGDQYMATLNGESVPIGDKVYAISDTLCATMAPTKGLSKENVTYENGWYTKPAVDSNEPLSCLLTDPAKYKNIHGEGDLDASNGTMEAVTVSTDMLAMFYYFQQLAYSSLTPGQEIDIAINLPDGDVQQLQIVYEGEDSFNGTPTHKLKFNYSYHGEMTDYPITAQVDQASKLPLLISADIKIGHIELVRHV